MLCIFAHIVCYLQESGGEPKLPVGMMMTGKHYKDDDLLSCAYAVEQTLSFN